MYHQISQLYYRLTLPAFINEIYCLFFFKKKKKGKKVGEIWKIDGTVVGTLMWTYQWWILASNLTSTLITWKNFSSGLTNPKIGRGDLDSLFFFG